MLDSKLIGRILQQKRQEKGLSQEVASSFADIGRTHLSAIERGKRTPTLETFFRLSYALKTKPSKLIKKIEEEMGEEFM
ncbi:MAG: helix-turn-helix transcriptional regulator [Ruminococcus sp.]|nr:helix-turn-helix transcriptional regulator [Ruminococcus sp.]